MSEQNEQPKEDTDIIKIVPKGTAEKFKEVGLNTIRDLSIAIPLQVAKETNMNIDTAEKYIAKAIMELHPVYISGKEDLEQRKLIQHCTTGSNSLDKLLGNEYNKGLEAGAVTELYGEFGSGKSQICHTLSVTAQLPIGQGGLDTNVIYMDTEGTFRSPRIVQIATARGLDPDKILSGISKFDIVNAAQLELLVDDAFKYIQELKARVFIVDSIIALHRAEGSDRAHLAARQQALSRILDKLKRAAKAYNTVVVVANQVTVSPDPFHPGLIATGGNIIAHNTTYRIFLRKSGLNRIARMVDSPSHENSEVRFTVSAKGIEDIIEDKK